MSQPEPAAPRANVVGFGLQERRLGSTILRTYRQKVDIDDVVPNERQPRLGAKEDEELQRQIEANEGLFEPLLVEPHPDLEGKFRIIDGERRWTNSVKLVEQGRDQYRQIPVEITDRTLTDEERLRVWIYIHRQRKEWDAREKEMVAYRLVDLIGRASAANILGISIRELQKLVEVYELSVRFRGLRDPAGAITWARELMGVSKKLLTPTVVDAVIEKGAAKRRFPQRSKPWGLVPFGRMAGQIIENETETKIGGDKRKQRGIRWRYLAGILRPARGRRAEYADQQCDNN